MEIKTLHIIDTEYPADTVEWCLHPNYLDYFVCGTYQLEDNIESSSPPCRRKGRIYLFRYNMENNILSEIFRLETAAILDMKWLTEYTNLPILSSANALGQIEIYLLENDQLILKSSFDLNTSYHNLLTLSLDWIPKQQSTNLNKIIASDSKGEISLLDYNYDLNNLKKISSWSAHNFEAWICAADKWNPNHIYTGGDDTFMHEFDIRSSDNISKIFTNKSHIAGVTCILSHPMKENILLTGSYDERLRIFDTRFLKNALIEFNLNGGIWRIKSDPKNHNLILCACMYHNFSIVNIGNDSKEINLVCEYNEHDSICYGADWCNTKSIDESKNEKLIMATCSFYDHKLCISSITE